MSRVWAVNDPIVEHRGDHWRKGTVASVNRWRIAVRWDDDEHACFRSPTDPRLVDPDEVPVDERHWLPASVRDQLVRQETAARLQALHDVVDAHIRAARALLGLPETTEAPPGGGPAAPPMEPR